MFSESEIKEIKTQLKLCEKGFSSETRGAFKYLIKMCNREFGGELGKVTCATTRKFAQSWLIKKLKI